MEEKLAEYRKEIDKLDSQIADLLKVRIRVVEKVGALKVQHAPDKCPLRPGREAAQLRRMLERFKDSAFLPEAVAQIWRTIISASLAVEGKLRIAVCITDEHPELFWLAREYFGGFTSFTREPGIKRILGAIIDGKADIGILPAIRNGSAAPWWPELTRRGPGWPKIFARIPFTETPRMHTERTAALAIGKILPEPSGDDISCFAFEAEDNTSMHKLQSAFSSAKLEAQWVDILTQGNGERQHCVEIKGFITDTDERFQHFLSILGNAVIRYTFLGAYATPLMITAPNAEQQRHE